MAYLADGIKAVAATGTAEALATSGDYRWVYVMAHQDNTGQCHIGASTVVSAVDGTARGMLVPDQTDHAASAVAFVPLRIDGPGSLSDLYVDAVTNADSVTWFALLES